MGTVEIFAMKYKGCTLVGIEYCTAINNLDYDQGWSMVFEERDASGKLIRTIKSSIDPNAPVRHRQWLKKMKDCND